MIDYYILKLPDPSLPEFVSGEKLYIGTEEDMLHIADKMEKSNVYEKTRNGITEYFNGNHGATHNIGYGDIPLLEPALPINEHTSQVDDLSWTHENTWHCKYRMKADSAAITQIVVRRRLNYYRCLRVSFDNLSYESVSKEWTVLSDFFLGHGFILDVTKMADDRFRICNRLFVVEEIHSKRQTAELALSDPSKIDFKPFCDEIFGDG